MSRRIKLYGGAIECCIPANWFDLSKSRQVPDHQEVYLDPNSQDSIVFELCQRVEEGETDEGAFRFHAANLLEEEGSIRIGSIKHVQVQKLPSGTPALLGLVGSAPDSKDQYQGIYLLVIRLVERETDIVVCINLPHLEENKGDAFGMDGAQGSRFQRAVEIMGRVIEDYEILDWSLFKDD